MQIKAVNQYKCGEVDLADQCNDKGGKGGDQKKNESTKSPYL